jgi:hypothetical protein
MAGHEGIKGVCYKLGKENTKESMEGPRWRLPAKRATIHLNQIHPPITLSCPLSPLFLNNFMGFIQFLYMHTKYLNHNHSPLSLFAFSLTLVPSPNSPCFTLVSFFAFWVFLSTFCIWERICDICLSPFGLFYLTWCSPIPSIFLHNLKDQNFLLVFFCNSNIHLGTLSIIDAQSILLK